MPGCPIRKSTDQIICADPRGLSQLITSFFASESQGIHRVPLFTFFSAYPFASICGCFYCLSYPFFLPACAPCGPHAFQPKEIQRLYCCLLLNFFLPICQRTFRLRCTPGPCGLGSFPGSVTLGGEYRSRTDDLLRARQAL